jgi:hypothetical protein
VNSDYLQKISTFAPEFNSIVYQKKYIKNEHEKNHMFLFDSWGIFYDDGSGDFIAEPVLADGSRQ